MNPGDLDTDRPFWTAEQAADAAGIGVRTWHAYVSRGRAPQPDGHVGRTPVWFADTIADWLRHRGTA